MQPGRAEQSVGGQRYSRSHIVLHPHTGGGDHAGGCGRGGAVRTAVQSGRISSFTPMLGTNTPVGVGQEGRYMQPGQQDSVWGDSSTGRAHIVLHPHTGGVHAGGCGGRRGGTDSGTVRAHLVPHLFANFSLRSNFPPPHFSSILLRTRTIMYHPGFAQRLAPHWPDGAIWRSAAHINKQRKRVSASSHRLARGYLAAVCAVCSYFCLQLFLSVYLCTA
jgi:hypothetical protein